MSDEKHKAGAAIIPVTPFQQNCTLIWSEPDKRGVVIDPGGDIDAIMQTIEKAGVTVERILLTHGHVDHAPGADELRRAAEGRDRGSASRRQDVSTIRKQGAAYGIADARNVTPDRWLDEGDSVAGGRLTSRCSTAPAIRRARSSSSTTTCVSRSSATSCSTA